MSYANDTFSSGFGQILINSNQFRTEGWVGEFIICDEFILQLILAGQCRRERAGTSSANPFIKLPYLYQNPTLQPYPHHSKPIRLLVFAQ